MQSLQLVAARCERTEDPLPVEAVRERAPARIRSERREVVEDLVHPAVLALEHLRHLRSAERCHPALRPARHAEECRERLAVTAQGVSVEESGHDLVQRVERCPGGLPGPQPIEELLGEGTQIAAADRRLAPGELAGDEHTALAHRRIPGVNAEQGTRREIVPGEMSAQLVVGGLPAAQGLGVARQPRADPKRVQQPLGIKSHQITPVHFQRIEHRAGAQADRARIKRAHRAAGALTGGVRQRTRERRVREEATGARGEGRAREQCAAGEAGGHAI